MSKYLTPKNNEKIASKNMKIIVISVLKLLCQIQKTKPLLKGKNNDLKIFYISYKKGNVNIIYSMSREKATA